MRTQPTHRLADERGFTIIELLMVVLIIGLLASIALPNFMRFQDRAKAARVKTNCHTVQLVAEDFGVPPALPILAS